MNLRSLQIGDLSEWEIYMFYYMLTGDEILAVFLENLNI